MDEKIKKLLSQNGSVAGAVDANAEVRKTLGLASVSDMAKIMRLNESTQNQQMYGVLSSSATQSTLASLGDVSKNVSALATIRDLIDKSGLNTNSLVQMPESLRAAIEGASVAKLAEQLLKNHVSALDDISTRYGVVSALSLASFASAAGLSAYQTVVDRVADELRARQTGLADLVGLIRPERYDIDAFRSTQANEIASLTKEVLARDSLSAYAFSNSAAVESLTSRMSAMDTPWLKISDTVQSAAAFAHLQAIGDIVRAAPPYAAEVAVWLRSDLGDWRDVVTMPQDDLIDTSLRTQLYVERGFNRSLTEFTPQAFHQTIAICSLAEVEWGEIEDWCPANTDELLLNKTAFDRLQRFEMAIRKFIVAVMAEEFGDNWMVAQLPNGMLDTWKEKQQSNVKAGADERHLIDYADFTDYVRIIERKDNWARVFKAVFGRPEDVRESLQRLYPVRLATMHARIITQDDLLLLIVETKRVVRSFGKILTV